MLAPESILHDHYRITYLIDERPDCVVYRAIDTRQSLRVLIAALPQPSEASVADVAHLAGEIATVSAPGLLTLRDHFAEGLTAFLVADDPGGQDLERVARDRGGPLPEQEVLGLVERLLGAVDALHSRSPALYLGELRAADIWSSIDGGLFLTPFGLARHISGDPSPYRAPELQDSRAEPTSASDVYAIGAVLYQLLTGWAPPSAAQRHAGTPLNSPRNLNARVSALAEQLALRSLELKAANRYQRAREMRSALETVRLMAGRPLGATAPIESAPAAAAPPVASPPAAPAAPANVYGPPPPAPPPATAPLGVAPAQPALATGSPSPQVPPGYLPSSMSQATAPAAAPRQPQWWQNTGCLVALVAALAVVALVVCVVGAIVIYMLTSGASGGIPFLQGAAANAPAATAPAAGAPTSPPAAAGAPTSPPALAATAAFTETRRIEEDSVGAAIYAPSGELAAVSIGSVIQLRTGENLDPGETLTGHSGTISALAFSPDSRLLASGAQDENTIRIWDVQSAAQVRTIDGHTGWIRSLAFSPDGRFLASGSTDLTIRIWDFSNGQQVALLEGHTDFIGNIAYRPDGAQLASASRDGTVRLWDLPAGTQNADFSYTAPQDPATTTPFWLTGISFSPDARRIAVGSISGSIYVLDAENGRLQRELQGHAGWVVIRGVSFSPDGSVIASASLDGDVRLWSPLTGVDRGVLSLRGLQLLGLSWRPDGKRLIAPSDTAGTLTIWDTDAKEVAGSLQLAQGVVTAMAYSDSGNLLATGGATGSVRVHILDQDREINLSGGAPTSGYIDFLSDTQLVAISDAGQVVVIDLTAQNQARLLEGIEGVALTLAVSLDRRLIAAGNERGDVVLWSAQTFEVQRTLSGLDGPVFDLTFSRDSARLVGITNRPANRPTVGVWDVITGDEVASYRGHSTQITGMDIHIQANLVASAASDGTLALWEAGSGREVRTIAAAPEQRWFSALAFSPDGSRLVTGSLAGDLSFWNPQSGELISTINLRAGSILALNFRSDGRQIAVSTRDGGILLLDPVS